MKWKPTKAGALWLAIWLFCSAALAGCADKEPKASSPSSDLSHASWEEIAAQAKGQKVNLYMWGGSESINRYVDEWVAPRLKEQAGVELRRVPIADAKDVINQLLVEKRAGKKEGNVDIIWINGENFKAAKENQLLWGPFTDKLPNFKQYVDAAAPDIQYDFGLQTEGLEAPWGKVQFVFIYDQEKIPSPPKSLAALKSWVREHPGKFTYPAPPDFTGSAFIRHALYEATGGYEQYMKPLEKGVESKWTPLWKELNEMEPYLWREGQTYPESLAKLDQLYASGEVWMTMGYDAARATNEMAKGIFPASTRTFVLDAGTLSNTHYLAIPFHSVHKEGAMAAINYLLSPEAQIAKYDPAHWGEESSIDPQKLSAEDQQKLKGIDRGAATLSSQELAEHRLPEIPADYVDALEKGWMEHVAKP